MSLFSVLWALWALQGPLYTIPSSWAVTWPGKPGHVTFRALQD